MLNPLRSTLICSPTCRPVSVSTVPLSAVASRVFAAMFGEILREYRIVEFVVHRKMQQGVVAQRDELRPGTDRAAGA